MPWSLAKANGQPVKTTKSQLLHLQEKSAPSASDVLPNAALVLDFMAVLQPVSNTFASLAYHYAIKSIVANVVSGGRVYLVIDQYPRTFIKFTECLRRAFSGQICMAVSRREQKLPHRKRFLSCAEN